jgi:hypothetical protein
VIVAIEQAEFGAGNGLRNCLACLVAHGPVALAVQYHGRRGHLWQQMSHVDIAQSVQHTTDGAGA